MGRSIVLIIAMLVLSAPVSAQNIAINATGAAPNASAMLDITSTNSGLLIPRMTAAQRTAIAGPATGLLVYETTTNTFWYYNGTAWTQLFTNALGWSLTGNAGTNAATNFLGTTDNVELVFRTNNLARMRIQGGGAVVVNAAAPVAGDVFSAYAGAANFAVNGYSTGNNGAGVYGYAQSANSIGIWADHVTATGTGLVGVGNGAGVAQTLVAGSGAAFTGLSLGMASFRNLTTNVNNQGSAYFLGRGGGAPQFAYVSYFTGGIWYKIIGTGSVSTLVDDPVRGGRAVMFAPEAPEILLQDHGTGTLVNGQARITLDPVFTANILVDESHPLRVLVQPEGDCNGVYVSDKTAEGFIVTELAGGASNVPFTWFVVANRADEVDPWTGEVISRNSMARFPPAPGILPSEELPGRGGLERP